MMMNENLISTTDALIADLLLHLKRSSNSSSYSPPPFYPPGWGDRKSRSKSQHRSSFSDGYDESTRPSSDLFSGNRSVKVRITSVDCLFCYNRFSPSKYIAGSMTSRSSSDVLFDEEETDN